MQQLQVFNFDNEQVRTADRDGDPWFVAADVCAVATPTDFHGFVYVIEYGDHVKIGHTRNIGSRLKQILSHAKNYSGVAIGRALHSKPHTNFQENERLLHKHFKTFRVGKSELFDISLNRFFEALPTIEYKDDRESIERKTESGFQFFKALTLGGMQCK